MEQAEHHAAEDEELNPEYAPNNQPQEQHPV